MAPTGRPRGRGRGRGRAARAGAAVGRGGSTAASAGNEDQAGDAAVESTEIVVPPAPTPAPEPTSTPDVSGGSSTMEDAPAAAVPAPAPVPRTRGVASTRARGASVAASSSAASSGSKFKPRAVRRGDAERERLAQEELRKQNIKLAEDQRLQRARGRGRRARGRGDAMGRGGFDRRYTAGNSIFGNPGASSSGFKTDSGFKSSGYRDQSNRLNADMFSGPMMDDYEEEETKEGASSSRQPPRKREVMPMGITRREPQKKELVVATTADMVAKEKAAAGIVEEVDDSPVRTPDGDIEMKDDGKVWPGASDNRKVKVKDEHGKFVEVTEIDDKRLQRAAEAEKKFKEEEEEEKKKPKVKVYQSREEETRERQYSMLLKEFGPRPEGDSKDGRLYLFQFPPTLPPLRVVHRPKPKSIVKDEPVDDDVVTMDVGETVDLTDGEKKADAMNGEGEDDNEDDPLNPYPETVGYVGKMIVRKSGRVEMDWGGFPFQVMPGITTNFITNAVLLEDDDKKIKQGEITGKAYGMGQIMGRFTVRPVYTKPEPGVIDPGHLEQLRQKARDAEVAKAEVLAEKRRVLEPLLQSLQRQ
ncbi:hypothetical protein PpBr36_07604 [Pyricularia pennisetigena]|uniref:hypothetical protein n=1 Tax=Pyricularia pennisetigena TaxID=1578925 RepID=UPI001154B2FB|nr:hypothetical protein PpBr36_07604 [Pyricularia pennisetigena]TLS25729.1 hypothetical protein PpBr36_07604 [Pyricularia pennisetigena]